MTPPMPISSGSSINWRLIADEVNVIRGYECRDGSAGLSPTDINQLKAEDPALFKRLLEGYGVHPTGTDESAEKFLQNFQTQGGDNFRNAIILGLTLRTQGTDILDARRVPNPLGAYYLGTARITSIHLFTNEELSNLKRGIREFFQAHGVEIYENEIGVAFGVRGGGRGIFSQFSFLETDYFDGCLVPIS